MKVVEQFKRRILDLAIRGKLVPPACRQAGKTRTTNPPLPEGWRSCWYTYVVECDDGSFYKGFTDDLMRRYEEHCRGIGAEHTKKHKPRQLYYWEQHSTQEVAIAREKYLKSGVGREWFKRAVVDAADDWEPASVLLERIKAEKAKLACLPDRQVKAGKIKKKKNPSQIVIGLPAGQAGSDGAAYEKFKDGSVLATKNTKDAKTDRAACPHAAESGRAALVAAIDVPFEIPATWRWVRFGDVTLNRDAERIPLSKDQRSHLSKNFDYYGASGIIDKVDKYLFDKPLLLVGEDGANLLARSTPIAFIASGKYWVNNHAHVIDTIDFDLLKYLETFINAIPLTPYITGTAQPKMNQEKINGILVPLPPIAEQKRIVAKIEELFSIADSLGAAADGLENAAKRLDKKILDLAIRGKLVPQDPNDEPASELVKRIAASHKSPCKNQGEPIDPPFDIPDSWEWVRLKELGVFCGGHTPSTSNPKLWGGDMLWVSSKDMQSKYIDDTQLKVTRLGAEELNVLKPGALLMCTRSGILRRVFPIAIARRELTINQDQRALTLWLPEMIEYVYLALKSLESIILSDYKKSGTTVESIIWNKFVNLPIPLPPLDEQKRIVKRVEALKATARTLVTF